VVLAQGSNQYRVRPRDGPLVAHPLPQAAKPAQRQPCGQVWGGCCRALVGPPGWSHGKHPDLAGKTAATLNPATPPEILACLAGDNVWEIRRTVANHPNTPPQVLVRLSQDRETSICQEAASNPHIPGEMLRQLAVHPSTVRIVASNPSTPPDVLDQIARQYDYTARSNVAGNTSTSAATLAWLIKDTPSGDISVPIRLNAAENPNTPPEILARLARSAYAGLRLKAAASKLSSLRALKRLTADENWQICKAVANNTSTPPAALKGLVKDADRTVRWLVASNTSTPPDILIRFAADPDPTVRAAAAGNTNTLPNTLAILVQDPSRLVRLAVAQNSNIPGLPLTQLTQDTDPAVRQAALDTMHLTGQRGKLSDGDSSYLCRLAASGDSSPKLLEQLSGVLLVTVRETVAQNPACPVPILEALLQDISPTVSRAAAGNPKLPRATLAMWQLTHDTDL